MNVLSLFSGVGGFDYGLENAGMKTIYQCEWDKHANSILERHWPQVPKWGDISTLTAKEILRHGTPPDVVAWGSPCQDLSVAGKRAGLEGERSGLFHEGIRIINELRKETNNEYPKISIWENVAGALSSNRGADFGVILDEMAKAGAMVIEWGLLDAQHFGIPQRRRRVFCIAIFNSATANLCPSPLLPVGESLPRDSKKGKQKRKSAASETSESVGAGGQWWDGGDIADAITTTSNEQRMPDKQRLQAIVEGFTSSSFAQYQEGVGTLRSNGGDLGGGSETLIAEPYVKSRRAQSATDDETWVPGEVNPTLNSFDVGDTRATTAIIEPILIDGRRVDDVRVYEPPVQTLGARMGTGGNNVPVIGFSHTQGLSAQPSEDAFPTLRTEGNGMAVAIPIDTRNALRDPEKYDAQNRQGLGIGNDGDPMATLTSTHVNAVAYDEYNDSINETHHALRAGTKQSTGVLLDAAGFKAGQGASAGSIGYQEGLSQTLTSNMNGVEPTVLTPTMAVRRLTPLECERLMGWPDDHTRFKADGTEQADTHRYKQCGNGVASPVAEWIGKQLMKLDEAPQ
jgi:DNA (cytosine-5)-methyltransferase 1